MNGRVDLHVARVAFARGSDSFLMYLSGGPGGAGVYEMIDVLFELPRSGARVHRDRVRPARHRRERAAALQGARARQPAALHPRGRAVRAAAGAERAFYTTPDTVADMEAIRRAVGARRLTLFGISYGTELALAYAREHPDRVERLILDSVVDPDESDPFGLAGFRAMGPVAGVALPRSLPRTHGGPGRRPDGADRQAARGAARGLPLRRERPPPLGHAATDRDRRPALRRRLRPGHARRGADGGARRAGERRRRADAHAAGRLARAHAPVGPARLLRRPLRRRVRGDAAAVAARHGARRPLRRRARARARAARLRVRAVRRRGRLRRRDRPLPALARSRPAAARAGRPVSRRADADPAGAGGPAHAARGVGPRRDPDRRHAAGRRAGSRARDRRRRSQRLRPAPAAALRRRRARALALPARTDRRAADGRAADGARRSSRPPPGWTGAWGGR